MTESTNLNKGDFYPIVGLYVQHLDPVSRDREAAVILGYVPGDVDLVSHAVLVRSGPGGELDRWLARGQGNSCRHNSQSHPHQMTMSNVR